MDGKAAPANRHSIENLAEEFMRLHIRGAQKRKRPEYVKRVLDVDVVPIWKDRDARTIKPREVVELLDGIVQRGSRVMANRVAGVLSQMFRFGVHRDLVEASPVQLLYRPGGRERPKDRTFSDTEIKALLANLDSVLRAAHGVRDSHPAPHRAAPRRTRPRPLARYRLRGENLDHPRSAFEDPHRTPTATLASRGTGI
jgi:integrase